MAIEGQSILRFDTGIEHIIDGGKHVAIGRPAERKHALPGRSDEEVGDLLDATSRSLEHSLQKNLTPSSTTPVPVDQVHFNTLFDASIELLEKEMISQAAEPEKQKMLQQASELLSGERQLVAQLTQIRKILLRI
jgi:Type III secretion system YscX (type_III_YscX)